MIAIFLNNDMYSRHARLFGEVPSLRYSGMRLKRTSRRLQQVGLAVSYPLVSAPLKSCYFMICFKLRLVT